MRIKAINLLIILVLACLGTVKAQTVDENNNRAVFNRIEFFFNSQQVDSIYNLANDNFKQNISKEKMAELLNNLFVLGRIENVTKTGFSRGLATYKVELQEETLTMQLAIDSNMRYNTFLVKPYSPDEAPKKEDIISNVEAKSPLDVYIDSVARSYAKNGNAHSLAVAVIHQNKINTFFYGETTPGNSTLPDANTLYEIGSVTKTFTATLLAEMVNQGTISLEDSIAKFLPDSVAQNPDIQKITFKMLANHTSGLPRLADNCNKVQKFSNSDPYAAYDKKALYAFLKGYTAKTEAGTEYAYSNLGYGLLGDLLSTISKKPYMTMVKEMILTPLEMTNTIDKLNPKEKNIAPPFDGEGQQVPFWNFQAITAAGSLKSSVNDLLRYTIAQLTYPETNVQKAMNLTKQFTFFVPPNSDIGLAWHMNMLDGVIYYHHTGATAGSNAFVGFVPDEKSVVIMLSNSSNELGKVGTALLEKVLSTK